MIKPFGIIPAMVTPVTAEDELNETALRKLTDHLVDGGVHGVFAIGSQGEFWGFSAEEKQRVWEVVVEQTAGRVPVYAGTAAVTTQEAIQLTRLAEQSGVDAVSVLTPYFISPNENELYDHYRAIAGATSLPIVLYSNPDRTGVGISPGLVARLAQVENIVGIKDSSGDIQLTTQYIQRTPDDFAVLMGRDTLIYVGLLIGAKGAIAATGNVVPSLVAQIYDRFIEGDNEGAQAAQEALDLIGLEAGPARLPVGPMQADQRQRLRDVLTDMGVL